MGLFSRKTKVQVAATVARVYTDDLLPSSVKTGMLRALINDDNIIDHVLEDLVSGIGMRANRMYDYASKHYAHGLPRPMHFESTTGKDIVQGMIEYEVGGPINIEYYHYGHLNQLHFGWHNLTHFHGYDPQTNQLGNLSTNKGTPVYLKDMVVVVKEATLDEMHDGSLDLWGPSPNAGYTPERQDLTSSFLRTHTPFRVDPLASGDYLLVSYVWLAETGELQQESLTIPFDLPNAATGDFYQVMYTYQGTKGWWTYESGSGIYPTVDAIFEPEMDEEYTGFANFFPITYFRHNGQSMDANRESPAYKTSTKMLGYLGMDYQSMIDAVNENPDVDQVEQAMMMMAVPANTENPLEIRYLFDFFNRARTASGAPPDWSKTPTDLRILRGNGSEINVAEEHSIILEDKKFKMALGYKAIFKRKRSGVIGPVGTYTHELGMEELVQKGIHTVTNEEVLWRSTVPTHTYRFQKTAGSYDEIMVHGLRMVYHIYGTYSDVGENDEPILMIPVDYTVTKEYAMPDREKLYARSLHYIFNSVVITKLKWYQTEGFKAILIIVMIVITIMTYGQTLKELAAAIASGSAATAMAAIKAILIVVLKQLVVGVVLKLFVKAAGIKIAFIAAVIAAAMGFYQSMGWGELGATWAEGLLKVATNLANAVNDVMTEMLLDLKSEAEAFGLYVEEKTKLLEETNKLLETSNLLTPFIFFGETPDQFYQRTVHSGNIGVMGIEAVASYVDMALTLPKLNETLGEKYVGY